MTEEQTIERYLFRMPADPEIFLCALAALQGLHQSLVVVERNICPHYRIYCPNPETRVLLAHSGLPNVTEISDSEFFSASCREYDLAFDFDTVSVLRLAQERNYHIARMFGVLLGGADLSLPILGSSGGEIRADVLVFAWDQSAELVELIDRNYPQLRLVHATVPYSLHEQFTMVWRSKMVVGVRSAATYMAAAAARAVVEVYPTAWARTTLPKWENPRYRMIYHDPATVPAALVYRAVDAAVRGGL